MTENDWQPVRIALAPKISPCGGDPNEDEVFLLLWRKHQGKIVRVRPVPIEWLRERDPNDEYAYQVHPDDIEKINFEIVDHLCEHQILAD